LCSIPHLGEPRQSVGSGGIAPADVSGRPATRLGVTST
jgi:hypothetical protein